MEAAKKKQTTAADKKKKNAERIQEQESAVAAFDKFTSFFTRLLPGKSENKKL